jgi:rSAM/selenodomain-associated transferase 1
MLLGLELPPCLCDTQEEARYAISRSFGIGAKHMPEKSVILLFIKAPIMGQVKSRLAAVIGKKAAFELYKCFILDIVDTIKKTGQPFKIFFYPPDALAAVTSWLGRRWHFMPQQGNDLGQRMENAFMRCFSEGFERAVLIGSDLPDLTPSVLHEAISSLAENDVVIGPAPDGGYYLIGFNKGTFMPRLFHGIPWSTETVFQETMTILQDSPLTVHRAPQWNDVDTAEDLKALFKRNKDGRFDNSRTMTYLKKIDCLNNKII